MKRTLLFISIALIVIGAIGRIYANLYSHVTPEGMVVDSIWLPIGTLMFLLGLLLLIISGIVYLISYLKNRFKN